MRQTLWPRGQMDKVSDYGSEDSRFESWRGRHFVSKVFNRERLLLLNMRARYYLYFLFSHETVPTS